MSSSHGLQAADLSATADGVGALDDDKLACRLGIIDARERSVVVRQRRLFL
jgi:hypothetical protein